MAERGPRAAAGRHPGARRGHQSRSGDEARANGAVDFDSNGWPIVAEDDPNVRLPAAPPKAAPAPAGESRAIRSVPPADAPQGATATASGASPRRSTRGRRASRCRSSRRAWSTARRCSDVFQFTQTPGVFKAQGGLQVWWLVTIYGSQGEVIGYREPARRRSTAGSPTRDRLSYESDGRVYGRCGSTVYAEKQGQPRATLAAAAANELTLFGLHARFQWCSATAPRAACSRARPSIAATNGCSASCCRSAPAGQDIVGPELEPMPRDRFEILRQPRAGGRASSCTAS